MIDAAAPDAPAMSGPRRGDTAGGAIENYGTDGFSLLEMLATLTILSLAVAFGARSIGGLSADRRPVLLAETIAAEIGRLRADAIRTGRVGRLMFAPDAARFSSSRAGSEPIAAADIRVTIETPSSVGMAPGEIRFLRDGSATGGRIVLAGSRTSTALTVSALTGRVRREAVQ